MMNEEMTPERVFTTGIVPEGVSEMDVEVSREESGFHIRLKAVGAAVWGVVIGVIGVAAAGAAAVIAGGVRASTDGGDVTVETTEDPIGPPPEN